ncbi:MAG: Acyltransferase family protein [Candidatus Nitrotoga sp. SPKER]|nr:MAG: Acyltransferase family protein [Candidatus Nitrotoga sp. SPKER]
MSYFEPFSGLLKYIQITLVTNVNKTKPAKLPELTGIRGLAALWVWLYHSWFVAGSPPVYLTSIGLKLTPFFSIGWIGVDLFFVLSGFVLVWPFLGLDARPFSFSEFMHRRALRVLPAYYFQLALLIAAATAGFMWQLPSWENTFSHVLLLHNFDEKWSSAINGPWWTLPIEWQFYLIFPLLISLLPRFGAWHMLVYLSAIMLAWRYSSFQWLQIYLPAASV